MVPTRPALVLPPPDKDPDTLHAEIDRIKEILHDISQRAASHPNPDPLPGFEELHAMMLEMQRRRREALQAEQARLQRRRSLALQAKHARLRMMDEALQKEATGYPDEL